MAGTAPDFQLPNSSFFNIYNDVPPLASASPGLPLPVGQCNFVDLTHGANGPKCGCRRFWSRGAISRMATGSPTGFSPIYPHGSPYGNAPGLEDQTTWCMCNHHACYHDDTRDSTQTPVPGPVVATTNPNGQENERPRTNREPLTPVMPDLSFKLPAVGQSADFHALNNAAPSSRTLDEFNIQQSEVGANAREPSLPDTLSWSNYIHSETDRGATLAPIPSQCLMSSQPSSTTSSARIAYLRPFAGKGLNTLGSAKSRARELLEVTKETPEPDNGTVLYPDANQSVDDALTVTNTPRSSRHTDISDRQGHTPNPSVNRTDFQLLSNTVDGHEQRIDSLENISFSAAAHDLCHDKHDQADLRVTELESRVEEVEKLLNDTGSTASSFHRPRRPGVDESTGSVVSVSTNTSSQIDRAELYSQLQALRAQLSQLQGLSSFPSPARPWEVEVVFLPFPLKNIWIGSRDFNSQRPSSNILEADAWTRLPNSNPSIDSHSPTLSDWAGPEDESEWLLARACSPDQTIAQRLKSRGLVKNVSVGGPDAMSVQQAISEAFGTLFRTFSRMQANVHHGSTTHHRVSKFLGLQSPWVPLRKVFKDSRLRFLSPAEMVTPVSWDVQFLNASVVMKSNGTPRLFITHPEAYLQDQSAWDNGWNWQRLRELSRVYADSQSSQEVPEGDAKEECWAWNVTLDEQPSTTNSSQHSSLQQAAQQNWRAVSKSPSHLVMNSVSLGGSRVSSRAQSPAMLKERKGSRPLHIRTSSMPPGSLPNLVSPGLSKRRATSYLQSYERRSSPQLVHVPPHVVAITKRRAARSPSIRPRNRNTPRWSTHSPTPLPEMHATSTGGRATTPFYATPYSNAPFVDTRPRRSSVLVIEESGDMQLRDLDFDGDTDAYNGEGDGDDEEHEIYEDDSQMVDLAGNPHSSQDSGSWQDGQLTGGLPEDEPWPGIEDAENRDPDLGIDIHIDDDAMSDGFETENADDIESQGSSVPSEYPSTHRAWTAAPGEDCFNVFEEANRSSNAQGNRP
ncbi:hypothetical protein F5Y15DRAFT_395322 [Xylariaceae sp. FL0016]|nr:hypothetical protein F5Y15DRAFT_395322 [Xylariaceae sp. FL0016]